MMLHIYNSPNALSVALFLNKFQDYMLKTYFIDGFFFQSLTSLHFFQSETDIIKNVVACHEEVQNRKNSRLFGISLRVSSVEV